MIWTEGTLITIATFITSWVLSIMPIPHDKREKLIHAQCFWWSDALTSLNSYWKIRVEGLENADENQTYVIVANHQSLADIIVIYKTKLQFKWVAKESLLKLPFIGGLLRVNKHIMLKRGKFGSIKEVYREAARHLRRGKSVLFFPEGTRSDTDEMNDFQNGAFKLAIKEKRPILPVFIGGTREAIPKGGWIFTTKVEGRVVVLPPVDTSGYGPGDFARLRDLVRGQLNALAAST